MIIAPQQLKILDLSSSAIETISTALDHLPVLVSDRALLGSESTLVETTVAEFSGGRVARTETITMPRRGFGPRPVNVLSSVDRTMYTAITSKLSARLPEPTRGPGKWAAFENFGLSGHSPDSYIVTIDIAACYEYVDHSLLEKELIKHSMDVTSASNLAGLLGGFFPTPRGLPQMMTSSDLLADTYLHAIERTLLRKGNVLMRFADDFKVMASDWGKANAIIEDAAESARDFGLVLSSEKLESTL